MEIIDILQYQCTVLIISFLRRPKMPMIRFTYNGNIFEKRKMENLARNLENMLRAGISDVRPETEKYGITVEGTEHAAINYNMPALNIIIDYHEEWWFKEEELATILLRMKHQLSTFFGPAIKPGSIKIRMYKKSGHASTSI